ncbi:MmgE/PrpD family protein [Rhodospirillaceae bacterium KN72]|uniref:MmgE/PrpD family protein n=1 Tax=Pacificispira spongiicola TaxID=2729598 RepID=A0A7Y0HHN5_9PROT|nr:MmgE/PrpD family protein [Pacificispira spongiicola]NMM46072.1 MmgE/PrpD family protein [Pacificispira spongiicola]
MTLNDAILDIAMLREESLPATALAMARHSLADWLVCGRAGASEPLSRHLRALSEEEAGVKAATVIGGGKAPARMAALVNGATSHALDYDDTHFAHIGHLSVGVYPAALAVGEEIGATADAVVSAFLVGAEAAIRIGMTLGAVHYNRGFHQTATAGAFGATVAAGRLYGLTRDQMRAAIGLCATRASGLKSQFGTMGKPYNAGIAAANGVECAKLAAKGFTSADDGLMGPQGFIPTHSDAPTPDAALLNLPPETFLFEDIKYKFHACCHGTHAMIEGLLRAKGASNAISTDSVARFTLRTNPRWLSVCNIDTPRTGLEVKFSYRWLAGMVLNGIATGSDRIYTDALARDPDLAAFAPKVDVSGDPSLTDMQAVGSLTLTDGAEIQIDYDLAARLSESELTSGLHRKAIDVLGADRAARLADLSSRLSTLTAQDLGAFLGSAE